MNGLHHIAARTGCRWASTSRFLLSFVLAACGRTGFERIPRDDGDAGISTPGDGGNAYGDMGDSIAQPNYAFVTSTAQPPGALGGLAGADALCALRAADAGLPGKYVAFLSTTSVKAVDRLAESRGWIRTDGRPVVDLPGELLTQGPSYPVLADENGALLAGTAPAQPPYAVVTATEAGGTPTPFTTCGDFVSSTSAMVGCGDARGTASAFTSGLWPGQCDAPMHLYCFGTDSRAPLPAPQPQSGRLAFYTPGGSPGGGLSGADAICQTEAATGGLVGTFRALLAHSAGAAASRFDLTGPLWVRPDGLAIAATARDLMDGNLLTTINLTATGLPIDNWVLTGAVPGSVPSMPSSETCSDWTVMNSDTVRMGRAGLVGAAFWASNTTSNCSACYLGYYCLEE